jgi:hypothetical protein
MKTNATRNSLGLSDLILCETTVEMRATPKQETGGRLSRLGEEGDSLEG